MNNSTNDAAAIFAPLWKRKWMILAIGILVAGATYAYFKRQTPVYQAKTQLYLGSGSEQQSVLNGTQGKSNLSSRALTDQVGLINSAIIGGEVHKQLRNEHNLAAARGKAKAASTATSDFITITSEAHTPRGAVTLANRYAQAYIKRQKANYLRSLKTAIGNTRKQLSRLEAAATPQSKGSKSSGAGSSSATIQAANLTSKLNQLESQLSYSGVQQVSPAKAAPAPISPTPKKNAIFGFMLGIVIAAIAAYLLSRFDHRMRSLPEIESAFGSQILTALPRVGSPTLRPDGRRAPAKPLLEPLRRLHTALRTGGVLADGPEDHPRLILFLSADAGDGKSTLIANLARVGCDSGERVAVIEADFRRPVQSRLFDLTGERGLADVLGGRLALDEAMQRVTATLVQPGPDGAAAAAPVSTVVESRSTSSLAVLPSGGTDANPALLGGQAMRELLRSVAEDFDCVLIDAPPPLEVSDVMPLLPLVGAIVIVARAGHTRDVSAHRLTQLLTRTSSAPVVGVAANCVSKADIERYGFSWTVEKGRRRRKLIGR